MSTKECSKCKIVKETAQFAVDKRSPNGLLQSWCKQCTSDSNARRLKRIRETVGAKKKEERARLQLERFEANRLRKNKKEREKNLINRDTRIVRQREYNSTERARFIHWKSGASRRGIAWDLTEEDIKAIPKVCHYTGIELTLEPNRPNTISLDRLDSLQGYTKANVVLCCARVNVAKSNLSIDEFIEMCRSVSSHNCV